MGFQQNYDMDALTAKAEAQKLAFGPFAFQATLAMKELGILGLLLEETDGGLSKDELAQEVGLSHYAVSVLVDFALELDLVKQTVEGYSIGPVGVFVLTDEMTQVNLNFTRDVCYEPLQKLVESLKEQEPLGLQEFGDWDTIYDGLTELPNPAKESWERFDHFYSDRAFESLLPVVFEETVDHLVDVGGNTGRWTARCLEYDDNVEVTLMDLPAQLEQAKTNLAETSGLDRIDFQPCDLTEEALRFPEDADVIWMSQVLDCFSVEEIRRILSRVREAMGEQTTLYVVELFPDCQEYETSTYCLNAISLYFTFLANGRSRFYPSDTIKQLLTESGFQITREIDVPSSEHTALVCELNS